jgi:amino-acid N-acetyltransferase
MRTRRARLQDAYAIYRLVNDLSLDGTLLHRSYAEVCRNIRTFTIVESEADEFIGCAALHVYGPHLAELRSIVVRSAIRGKGAGGLLVESLLAEAAESGIRCVCLFTRIPTFFEHFNFRVTPRGSLHDKLLKDCRHCARRNACDETPMVIGELPVQQNLSGLMPFVGSGRLVQLLDDRLVSPAAQRAKACTEKCDEFNWESLSRSL